MHQRTSRAVEVVLGRDSVRLAVAGRCFDKSAAMPPEAVAMAHEEAVAEMAAIKKGIATGDEAALEAYGGLNPALPRTRVLNAACAGSRRSTAAITTGRTWRSPRVPSVPHVTPARPPETTSEVPHQRGNQCPVYAHRIAPPRHTRPARNSPVLKRDPTSRVPQRCRSMCHGAGRGATLPKPAVSSPAGVPPSHPESGRFP